MTWKDLITSLDVDEQITVRTTRLYKTSSHDSVVVCVHKLDHYIALMPGDFRIGGKDNDPTLQAIEQALMKLRNHFQTTLQ